MPIVASDAIVYGKPDESADQYAGDVIAVRTYGYPVAASLTPDQEVLTPDGWKPSGDLRPLDWLVCPIPQGDTEIDELRELMPPAAKSTASGTSRLTGDRLPVTRDALKRHLEEGLTYQQIAELYGRTTRAAAYGWALHYGLTRPANKVLRGDPIEDPNFWRVVGYWLAEGDITAGRSGGQRNVVRWTFGHTEQYLADDTAEVLGKYGIKVHCHPVPHGSSLSVRCSSSQLAQFLGNAGHGAHHKVLPTEWLHLPRQFAQEMVRGYWIGDGTVSPEGGTMNDGWARIASVSLSLASSFYRLLPRLGVVPALMCGRRESGTLYDLRFPVASAPWLNAGGRPIMQRSARIDGTRLLVKVKTLEASYYEGPVTRLLHPSGEVVLHNFCVRAQP